MEQRYAFVLRIWLTESSTSVGTSTGTSTGQTDCSLRGTLQSANSTEPTYFNSLRQLNDLIEIAMLQNDSSIPSSGD